MIKMRFHTTCRILLGIGLAGLLASCAPKPGDKYTNAVEKACAEAKTAEAKAKANTAEYDSLQLIITQKQAVKVKLERLRSRVKTKQISDDDLAQWLRDREKKPEPDTVKTTTPIAITAISDSTKPVSTDTVGTAVAAPVDTAATASPALEAESTPADTAGTTTPAPETPKEITPAPETTPATPESGTSAEPESGTTGAESTEPAPAESGE